MFTPTSAITFYFKDLYPDYATFKTFLTQYDVIDVTDATNDALAQKLFKYLFREYHNSNIQFDTPCDFNCTLANIIEDMFDKYKQQLQLIQKVHQMSADDLEVISRAIANSAQAPNSKQDNIEKPLEYINAQAYTVARTGRLQAYLQAINTMPTLLIKESITACRHLFKTILPNVVYYFDKEEN